MNRISTALRAMDPAAVPPVPGDLADGALARARQRSRRRGLTAVVGASAAAVLVAVGVTIALPARAPDRTAPATGPLAQPRVNVLVLGTDEGPGRVGVRPDTIMVVSTDTRSGDTTLVGVPRSLERVPFPAGSAARRAWPRGFACEQHACVLGSVWTWAEGDGRRYFPGDADPGLTATTQAVSSLTGLPVDETVVLTTTGLAALVDAVGGVDVTVRERLPIGGTTGRPVADRWIERGPQHLDGPTAAWYARSRWSTNDHDRMARQRCLVRALVDRTEPDRLVRALPRLLRLDPDVRSSVPVSELPAWGRLLGRVRNGSLTGFDLSPADPAAPDVPALRAAVAQALRPGTAGPARPAPEADRC